MTTPATSERPAHLSTAFPMPLIQADEDNTDAFYTDHEFLDIVDRECMRADHFAQHFALVTFKISPNAPDYLHLQRVLMRRLRSSDLAGWINHDYLGVILSDTATQAGVDVFIHSVQRMLRVNQVALPTCTSHLYPQDWCEYGDFTTFQAWKPAGARRPPASTGQIDLAKQRGAMMQQPPKLEKLLNTAMPWWKRSVDMLGAAFGLLFLSPLLVLVALYIKSVSIGPVFFRQERIGYLGKSFIIWKFRTMRTDADTSKHQRYISELLKNGKPMYKLEDTDPHIIPYGNVLRKTGIDELPQLFNVLRGEMSLIGPRPDVLYAVKNYKPWHHGRCDAYPGLTGLWQVSGKNNTSYDRMMSLDITYARELSFWLDLKILLSTPLAILAQVRDSVVKQPAASCVDCNSKQQP